MDWTLLYWKFLKLIFAENFSLKCEKGAKEKIVNRSSSHKSVKKSMNLYHSDYTFFVEVPGPAPSAGYGGYGIRPYPGGHPFDNTSILLYQLFRVLFSKRIF